jgi:hypothetical protein
LLFCSFPLSLCLSFPLSWAQVRPTSARWPDRNTTINTGGAATMGYKGIITSYLPRTGPVTYTVVLKDGTKQPKYE